MTPTAMCGGGDRPRRDGALSPEDGQFCSGYTMRTAEEYSGSSITSIPDDDPGDERISFCLS